MKLAIVLLAACVAIASGQNCDNSFQNYLYCLETEIDDAYVALENEFKNDWRGLITECFNGQSGKCFAQPQDEQFSANYVFGRNGPLKGCRICQTIARAVRGLIDRASASTMKCIRDVLRDGIADSLRPCIEAEHPGYRQPRIPDFEKKGQNNKKALMETTATFLGGDFLVKQCARRRPRAVSENNMHTRLRRSKQTARATRQCLDGRNANGAPIWTTHCTIMKSCRKDDNVIAPGCARSFAAIEKTTCGCIQSNRGELLTKIGQARNKLIRMVKAPVPNGADRYTHQLGQCTAIINGVIDFYSKKVDLETYFDRVKNCATEIDEATRNSFTIAKLVNMGCRRVARQGKRAANELSIALRFFTSLFNALVQRTTRFCPGTHCQP